MLFTYANYFVAIVCSIVLILSLRLRPHCLVKPSTWIIGFFNMTVQWSAARKADEIQETLRDYWSFFILCQIVPSIWLLWNLLSADKLARQVWARLRDDNKRTRFLEPASFLLIFGASLGCTMVFLHFVPFARTGLMTMLMQDNGMVSRMAREDSTATLSMLPRYCYALNANVIAPICSLLLMLQAMQCLKRNQLIPGLILLALIGPLVASTALSGSRTSAAYCLAALAAGFWLQRGGRIEFRWLLLGGVAVLLPATLSDVFRDGDALNLESILDHFLGNILGRTFEGPMITGLWHCEFMEANGYWGVGGIPKLAALFGVQAVNTANILANQKFTNIYITTGTINTSFVFSYYTYFGFAAVPFVAAAVPLLDLIVRFYARIKPQHLIAAIVAINFGATHLNECDFTTVFITYGFFSGSLVIWALGKVTGKRVEMEPSAGASRERRQPPLETGLQVVPSKS